MKFPIDDASWLLGKQTEPTNGFGVYKEMMVNGMATVTIREPNEVDVNFLNISVFSAASGQRICMRLVIKETHMYVVLL